MGPKSAVVCSIRHGGPPGQSFGRPKLDPDEFAARRQAAETVARDAGQLAQSYLADRRTLKVARKGPQDVVTEADSAVERMIIATLRSGYPGDTFIGEEGGGAVGERCWVIDPIDGTTNFARGLPHWCVSIALVVAGRTEVGVIFDPNADLLYSAQRGSGARCNNTLIQVSGTTEVAGAMVDVGYSSRTGIDDFGTMVTALLQSGVNVTQAGSAALGLARVADGRLDGYAERHLYAWDVLAGMLLVEEAGGCVNEFLAGNSLITGNETIAATPALYAVLAAMLMMRRA